MTRHLWILCGALAAVLLGCPDGGVFPDGGPKPDGSADAGPCPTGFCISTLETNSIYPGPSFAPTFAVAQRNDDMLGVAYFVATGADGGAPFDVRYFSWNAGTVSAVETVNTVQQTYGIALAFRPNGEPSVTYLGGDDDGQNLADWPNSDAVLSERNGGVWTQHIAVNRSNEAIAGNPVSDSDQPVVGVYPAIAYDSTGTAYFVYRDVHGGQFTTDWDKSDMELAQGGPSSWTHKVLIAGGNNAGAWGGDPRMIVVANQPVVLSTTVFLAAAAPGRDVWFMKRSPGASNGTYFQDWTNPVKVIGVGNAYSAPVIAYDSSVGFGVAVSEVANTNRLTYQSSTDGSSAPWTTPPDPIYESGSGGWYPSLAFDPATHYPHVAFYVCALTLGVTEGNCPQNEDELRVSWRTPVRWETQTVDPGGAYQPWMFFLANGKRVLVYRDIRGPNLKVAVEQ